jgi:TRAP-type C4-dicarboxylate transport system permease small subunit
MLGTAIAFKKGSHLGMEFIYERFPYRIKKVLFLLSAILSIAFFVVLGWLGAIEVKDEIDLCVITESLAIPVWYYTIAIPVFSVLVIFRILQNVVTSLRDHSY